MHPILLEIPRVMNLTVTSLHIYPVKSLGGITLPEAELCHEGLRYDRQWMLLDRQGRFLSQRHRSTLTQIATGLNPGALMLEASGVEPLRIPFRERHGPVIHTEIWGDACEVIDEGDHAAQWLAQVLGTEPGARLVRLRAGFKRPQKHPARYGKHTSTQFADSAPYLITVEETLAALNTELTSHGLAPVAMNRFRANIVLSGVPAFAEHRISALKGHGFMLRLCYPRERCVITTIDQETGRKDAGGEPFKTLRRLNPMHQATPSSDSSGPAFGELAVLDAAHPSCLRVGDQLVAVNKGE